MIGGFAAISKQYQTTSLKIAKTKAKTTPSMNLCKITNVYEDTMTADIYLPEDNAYVLNVPISFPSKGYGYGSYFMPIKGQLALAATTNYGRMFILASSCVSDNNIDQRVLSGENMILASSGAFMRQDYMGNHIVSSGSGNLSSHNANLSNTEITTGKEERTISSNLVNGFALDINKISESILNKDTIKPINYEEYYGKITTIKTYSSSDILQSDTINSDLKNEILNNASDVIMKLTNFVNKCDNFIQDVSSSDNDSNTVEQKTNDFTADIASNFKLGKNVSLVIQKGNVVSKQVESLSDIYNLQDSDFLQSSHGNDLVFKLSVIDPVTKAENAYIAIDSAGNGYMKFKDLQIIKETGGFV